MNLDLRAPRVRVAQKILFYSRGEFSEEEKGRSSTGGTYGGMLGTLGILIVSGPRGPCVKGVEFWRTMIQYGIPMIQ